MMSHNRWNPFSYPILARGLPMAGILLALSSQYALAADETQVQATADRCAAIKASVVDAGFADSVTVDCDHGHAHLHSNVYPKHEMMTGIVGSNEQVPIPAWDYVANVPLATTLTTEPKTRDSSLAVAVNGVPIFDYTGGGEMSVEDLYHQQTEHDTVLTQQLDKCGGHAGRGDDYHYHALPTCMIDQMKNAGDAAIIGWAFDGFPLYGSNNPDGTAIPAKTLDVCNGQADKVFGYRYHTSEKAPYIIQCLMGEAGDLKDLPRVAPLRPAEGADRMEAGRPPEGGVENLVFTQNDSGAQSMDYTYKGSPYYIRYKPSDKANCYIMETRTVTNNGELKTGEYCR